MCINKYLIRENDEGGDRLLVVSSDKTRSNGQKIETRDILSQHTQKTLIYCAGEWPLVQVTQRGFGLSMLGNIQNPAGHDPGQAALADPA